MRAGLSTIQQTLTPEAASVLNHSIAESGRRNHGQTTPLHVAATLLSSPNGYLRQACIKSHPNSSHPLQCRALELCFSVALERLPTAQNASPGAEPPISNALMAALKRAQAHQRRGCPEQQQQPLLAVKVELEQLIISILDDPSVSRVMREASFSSPAVKATIEQSLNSSPPAPASGGGLGFRPSPVGPPRNLYLNPRLQQQGSVIAPPLQQRGEEVRKVIDIMLRSKKRNPVLVGESEPEAVVKELSRRIENRELGDGTLSNVQVIHLEKEICSSDRIKELGDLVESRMESLNGGGGVILDMGDLKWLVQQQPGSGSGMVQQQVVSDGGRVAVVEMGKLLAKYGNGGGRLWLIGTATCETYLRCQVYHPSMENDWDLQAVPIAARAPLPGLFPRLGTTGILNSPIESLSSNKGFPTVTTIPMRPVMPQNLDSSRRTSCCSQCKQNYEWELEKLVANEFDKPSSVLKPEGAKASALPPWLQNAKAEDENSKKHETTENLNKELVGKQKTQELQKKWHDTCLRLHPNFHNLNKFGSERTVPMSLPLTGLYSPNLLGHQPSQTKLQLNKGFGETLQMKTNPLLGSKPSEKVLSISRSGSPVRTELALGRMNNGEILAEETHKERVKDFLGCISSEPENKVCELRSSKFLDASDIDSYKRLFKGILEKVWWQQEAASALATSVTQFKLGNGKRRGGTVSKGDMWLLFLGPDRVGKKKMATALAELVSGSNPVTICLGSKRSDGESDISIRGRTVLDKISEAVRKNRFSVIVLDDFDESNLLVRGSIKRAMERGRFTDSHGREISLGNIIFILTANWIPDDMKHLSNGNPLEEEKFASLARSTWQLKLSLREKTVKRRAEWVHGEERCLKPRAETGSAIGTAFDLNEAADAEDEKTDGSLNSSDVTTDHETEHGLNTRQLSFMTPSASREMFNTVDDAIVFKPVDFAPIKHNITSSINKKFSSIVGEKISLELQENALEKITSGVWLGRGPSSLVLPKIQDFLLLKLNELTFDHLLLPYLRLVLFWAYQIRISYRFKPIVELEQLSQICFMFLQNILAKLLASRTHSGTAGDYKGPLLRLEVQDVAETIFSHPAVISSLSCPLNCPGDLMNDTIDLNLESLVQLSGKNVNTLDRHIVNLLTTFCEHLITSCDGQDSTFREVVETFNVLIQRLFSEFRDRFDLFIDTMDLIPLLPPFFALHALNHFISPFDLLELVTWIFKRVNINDLVVQKSETTQIHGLSFGFGIAVIALKDVTGYLQLSFSRRLPYNLFWEMDEKNVCNIIDEIYTKTNVFALHYKSEFADTCLLEVVKAICAKKSVRCDYFDQIHLATFRFIMNIPSALVSYCINRTNKEKAKLLYILTEASSLHLSIFGHFIVDVMNKHSCHVDIEMEDTLAFHFSDEEFFMLLPTSLSYLNSVVKFGKKCWYNFKGISSVYSRILFQGLCKWKSFVSKSIFYEEFGDLVPLSTQEFIDVVNDSLLGKAVSMLRHHFAFSGDLVTVKKRLKLFNYIFPASCSTDGILEFEVDELDSYSLSQVLNFLNKVVAKISFCRVLLFPEGCSIQSLPKEDEKSTEHSLARRSNKEESSRLQYLNILVSIWQWIVKRFAFISDIHEKEMDNSRLFRCLELFILNNILELSTEMHDALAKLPSIPFLEQLMRFSLLYRFEDTTTLNILYSILNLLSDGKFAEDVYLQLLLAHSQFAPTIHSAPKPSHSIETFLRPISSILRSLVIPSTNQWKTNCMQDSKTTQIDLKRLVIVKLVHVLVLMKVRQGGYGKEDAINFRELHSLLLSSYGATISETDSTILKTLNDVETIVGSDAENLVQMDFLWGNAVLRVSKERLLEQESSSNIRNDAEVLKERHKNQFRENLPVDPRICVSTVLCFPHDRTELGEELRLKKYQMKDLDDLFKGHFHGTKPEQYDPVYVLRFSIHALSMGYIEALEFATLGLLAIAFVSLSSANDILRKLGYETLGALKDSLEKCKRRKGTMRLRLLLTYLQNGIEEPWQRIPSIIALFAAEASFILLEPSHHHYPALSKFLVRSSRMNRKSIPLFKNFLWSSSVNFKSERLWMLRLVYVGINVDDDARLYIKNSIHEDLQSFYVSSLSDNESKELILQVMKKSVKLQRMTFYLVEHGLFSWLCSIISTSSRRLTEDQKSFFSKQLILVLEVVNNVTSFRNICEWLQINALEQLMEFSSNLFKILLGGEQLLIEGALVNQILQIITSVLRISQKRKIYQPHYTLSIEGLFHIYQAVHRLDCTSLGSNSASGLKVILMNMPQITLLHMDLKKCSDFLSWAISTALESDSRMIAKESHLGLMSESDEEHFDESLTSKLLRWLSASVILGRISWKLDSLNLATSERSSAETLYSLLEHVKNRRDNSNLHEFGCEELLAANIFYLQQHLKSSFMVLPVVISALCLLLCDALISAGLFHSHGADLGHLAQLLSKIRCPEEANPAWRWTFYQPWKDYSLELTDLQKVDEVHACQTLQVVISNILSKKPLDPQVLLPQDIEISRVFEWERNIVRTQNSNP